MPRVSVGLASAFALVAGIASAVPAPAAPAAGCVVATSLPAPPRNRPHYGLRVRVEPGLMAARGTLTVSFTPSVPTDRIVFRLWPNSPFYAKRGASLAVRDVTSSG